MRADPRQELARPEGPAHRPARPAVRAPAVAAAALGWRADTHARFVVDVDADGRKDVVGFGSDTVWVSTSTGASFTPPRAWLGAMTVGQGWTIDRDPCVLADVDGDGRMDVVGF